MTLLNKRIEKVISQFLPVDAPKLRLKVPRLEHMQYIAFTKITVTHLISLQLPWIAIESPEVRTVVLIKNILNIRGCIKSWRSRLLEPLKYNKFGYVIKIQWWAGWDQSRDYILRYSGRPAETGNVTRFPTVICQPWEKAPVRLWRRELASLERR